MLKFFVLRFILRLLAFVGLILPVTFAMALLMAPPAPAQPLDQGCDRNLASASASVATLQARVKNAAQGPEVCNATRLYFLEVVKARAVTAVCKTGPDRDRELVRLDADVQSINEAIAARCS